MYAGLLHGHSMLRWVAIGLVALAFLHGVWGWLAGRDYGRISSFLGIAALVAFAVEYFVGAALYLASPVTTSAFADFDAALKDRQLRFFTLDHPIGMTVALVFAHLGCILARRGASDKVRHRRAALYFGMTLGVMLASVPWWRPLLPGAIA